MLGSFPSTSAISTNFLKLKYLLYN